MIAVRKPQISKFSAMNASAPIYSGRLRWTTIPGDCVALLRTCLRLRSLRAPRGEKENNNGKSSPC